MRTSGLVRKKSSSRVAKAIVVSLSLVLLLLVAGCSLLGGNTTKQQTIQPAGKKTLILATTTSTKDTGLLDVLLPAFESKTGYTVKPVAVGSGQAFEMGQRGEADVLLVHAPKDEAEFVAQGFGAGRRDVMYNYFVILGPKNDPAGVKGMKSAVEALKKIAAAKATFVSRGDDSGTNKKELKLWDKAGVKPSGGWYIKTGQGMGSTLRIAGEKQGYTLADTGTFLSLKGTLALAVLVEKNEDLLNQYGVIPVNSEKLPKVNSEGGKAFADWIVSQDVQKLIGEYGKDEFGEALFTPNASADKP